MRILVSLIVLLGVGVSTGCQPNPTDVGESLEPNSSPVVTSLSTPLPVSPTKGDTTQMTPSLPTPTTSGLENLIEKAKEDLAQQLSISITQISLVEAVEVTWPDSSIGCPQDGMVYAQVLTPGYLILLGHDGNTFEYHASKGNYVITCTNPFPPVPGTPANT